MDEKILRYSEYLKDRIEGIADQLFYIEKTALETDLTSINPDYLVMQKEILGDKSSELANLAMEYCFIGNRKLPSSYDEAIGYGNDALSKINQILNCLEEK